MTPPLQPDFKSFLISPPVRAAMDAQPADAPKPIPVIITFVEAKDGLDQGIARAKSEVKAFLESRGYTVRASDFYIFASLRLLLHIVL